MPCNVPEHGCLFQLPRWPHIVLALNALKSSWCNFLCLRKAPTHIARWHGKPRQFLHRGLFRSPFGCGNTWPSQMPYKCINHAARQLLVNCAARIRRFVWMHRLMLKKEICCFTHRLQFAFFNKATVRPVVYPSILSWFSHFVWCPRRSSFTALHFHLSPKKPQTLSQPSGGMFSSARAKMMHREPLVSKKVKTIQLFGNTLDSESVARNGSKHCSRLCGEATQSLCSNCSLLAG